MLNIVKYQNSQNLISPLGFRKDWWFWKNNIKLNVKKIISFLLKEETKILKKYKSSGDGNVNLPNSVTARHASFNLFTIKDNKNNNWLLNITLTPNIKEHIYARVRTNRTNQSCRIRR